MEKPRVTLFALIVLMVFAMMVGYLIGVVVAEAEEQAHEEQVVSDEPEPLFFPGRTEGIDVDGWIAWTAAGICVTHRGPGVWESHYLGGVR